MIAQIYFAFFIEGTLGDEACAVAWGRVFVVVQDKGVARVKNLFEEGGVGRGR